MPKRSEAVSTTISPPTGGWNTRDPISGMDPQYAVEMENFFPDNGTVNLRNGYAFTGTFAVDTAVFLQPFKAGSIDKLIAIAANKTFYDVSAAGAAVAVGSFANGFDPCFFCQYRSRIFATDATGLDDVQVWDGGGGGFVAAAFTGPGGDDKLLGPMCSYKSRLYFAERSGATVGNLSVWYGGVDFVTGALTEFPLSSIFRTGGYIIFIGSVTRAKDFSEDELFCIINSEGEILLYQGDYPGSLSWGILGRYFIPKPLGDRAFFYVGNDLMIITRQGVFSMRTVMAGDNFSGQQSGLFSSALTSIINSAFQSAVLSYFNGNAFTPSSAWMGIHYPQGNYLLINIPTTTNTITYQFVMNTTTGAWCKFSGMSAFNFAIYKDNLLFPRADGTNGGKGGVFIMQADSGYYDNNGSAPTTPISRNIKLRPAYNYLGDTEKYKQFVEARPIIYQDQGLSLTMDADVDYANTTATNTVTDSTDTAYKLYKPRLGLNGIGKAISLRIDGTVTTKRMSLQAMEIIWKEADIV